MRLAAFDHVRRLTARDGVLESATVAAGFMFHGGSRPVSQPAARHLQAERSPVPPQHPHGDPARWRPALVRRPDAGAPADLRGRRRPRLRLHGQGPRRPREPVAAGGHGAAGAGNLLPRRLAGALPGGPADVRRRVVGAVADREDRLRGGQGRRCPDRRPGGARTPLRPPPGQAAPAPGRVPRERARRLRRPLRDQQPAGPPA